MRKTRTLILSLIMTLILASNTFALFSDVPENASYIEALNRLSVLGIMGGNDKGGFMPDDMLTREQFAKVIVVASGLESDANALKGATVFADISNNAWSSGYINEALSRGFITGMPDGKFHPSEKVTFAQACTVLVKALGYTDTDLNGYWPNNYIEKARSLNLFEGIDLGKNDGLPRWAAAVMINKLLSTNVKKTSPSEADKTFAEASGLYTCAVVLADSGTSDKLLSNQILTDKGIYYIRDDIKNLELGNKYEFYIKDEKISKVYNKLKTVVSYTIDSTLENRIAYKDSTGKEGALTLPDKTVYYYNGIKQSYDNLKNILQANTTIVFANNDNNDGFDYAVIYDPVYSKPELGNKLDSTAEKIGNIDYKGGLPVIKNGQQISVSEIDSKDAVYKVSDIYGKNAYLLVAANTIEGKYEGLLPSGTSPKQIQIDSKIYDFSRDMDISKIKGMTGSFKLDDEVIAVVGYDGKIVDVLYPEDDGVNYAFVLNYTITGSEDGNIVYAVKLLLPNKETKTYKVDFDPSDYKGELITYSELDDERIYINEIGYPDLNTQNYTINKDEGKIDSDYIADNVKIFNLISSEDNSSSDTEVNILDWKDIPSGTFVPGQILYLKRSGDFNDISIVVTNDILNQKNKLGVIKKVDSKSTTLLIDGKEYAYSSLQGFSVGSVFEFSMTGNSVGELVGTLTATDDSSTIQAMDDKRIKLGNKIYRFMDDVSIYLKDFKGELKAVSYDDIDISDTFARVAIYTNSNGRVRVIVVSEK